jgi:uncharacterized PurR-regulated membrane protein YhhQ (DUF165 family)
MAVHNAWGAVVRLLATVFLVQNIQGRVGGAVVVVRAVGCGWCCGVAILFEVLAVSIEVRLGPV